MNAAAETQMLYSWPGGTIFIPGKKPPDVAFVEPFQLLLGQRVAIHGAAGCGKSFFLSLLTGLADQSLLPKAANSHVKPLTSFVFVPQFPAVRRELTVRQECLYVWKQMLEVLTEDECVLLLGEGITLHRRFDDLTALLRMENYRDRRIAELSGGTLKRFGLLLRLPFRTPILVLDEPDTGLDGETATTVLNDMHSERLFNGLLPAVLLVTHRKNTQSWAHVQVEVRPSAVVSAPLPHVPPEPVPQRSAYVLPFPRLDSESLHAALSSRIDRPVYSSWPVVKHQLRMLRRNFQDVLIFMAAPALIFLILSLSTGNGYTHNDGPDKFAKYAFFAIVANVWLGLQLSAKTAVQDMQVFKEDFWWLSGLRAGRDKNLWPYVTSLTLGLLCTLLVTSLIQSAIGAAIFLWRQPFVQESVSTLAMFTVVWMSFAVAAFYGATLGLALGGVIAWWNLCVYRPHRRPNSVWVNLTVPVVMLTHIVFSPVYLHGLRYAGFEYATRRDLLARSNVCAALSGIPETMFASVNQMPLSIFGSWMSDEVVFIYLCWWIPLVAVILLTFRTALCSADIRRE